MKISMRSIKRTAPGKYSRSRVRDAVTAVHVLESAPTGAWEVRTLGEKGAIKTFDAKEPAIEHALSVKKNADVVLHLRDPKKVMRVRATKRGGRFEEVKFR